MGLHIGNRTKRNRGQSEADINSSYRIKAISRSLCGWKKSGYQFECVSEGGFAGPGHSISLSRWNGGRWKAHPSVRGCHCGELWAHNEWLGWAARRITYIPLLLSVSPLLFQDVYKYKIEVWRRESGVSLRGPQGGSAHRAVLVNSIPKMTKFITNPETVRLHLRLHLHELQRAQRFLVLRTDAKWKAMRIGLAGQHTRCVKRVRPRRTSHPSFANKKCDENLRSNLPVG